jgi:hypothetical protein
MTMITERIKTMLQACEGGDPPFPPTVLFNENWLLRLVVDWFVHHAEERHPMVPAAGAGWFSEAWLPSAFLPRYRGDPLAESRTHADGVMGHFAIGDRGAVDLALRPDAGQFVVIEAKIAGRLSPGVKNAPFFDQAARSVACIAEALRRVERPADRMDDLAFYLVAPRARIDEGVFEGELAPASIRDKVRRRVDAYEGTRDDWFRDWFEPTLENVDILCVSWEDLIDEISFLDMISGQQIDSFYGKCLHFNRRGAWPGPRAAGGGGTETIVPGHAALGPDDLRPGGTTDSRVTTR